MTIFVVLVLLTLIAAILLGTDFGRTFLDAYNRQQAQEEAPGGGGEQSVPPISERFFSSGTTRASISGAMTMTSDLAIDEIASYVSADGLAWISFGDRGGGSTEVLIAFNEPENSVTVAQGDLHATGIDDDCIFRVSVTPTLVTGRISCASVEVLSGEEPVGNATIELDFSAGS